MILSNDCNSGVKISQNYTALQTGKRGEALIVWLKTAYALLASVPFLSFFLFWAIGYLVTRNKNKSLIASMNITLLLLIGAVTVMINTYMGTRGGFWVLLLFFLLVAGLFGNLQHRKRGRVDPQKLLRAVSRLGFIVLAVCYFVFLILGISRSIMHT